MDNLSLTAEQFAHIVCLPRQRQLDMLKEVTEGDARLAWHAETHVWRVEPEDKPEEPGSEG